MKFHKTYFFIILLFCVNFSSALVVENFQGIPLSEIPHNSLGRFGSTAQVITSNHIITADHVDNYYGGLNKFNFIINGTTYVPTRVYHNKTYDLKIVEFSNEEISLKGPLPRPYVLTSPSAPPILSNDLVYMGGYGQYATSKSGNTFIVTTSWTGNTYPRWGVNKVSAKSNSFIGTSFSSNNSLEAIPLYESQLSGGDSGSGVFLFEDFSCDVLVLSGVGKSVSSLGNVNYGFTSYYTNLENQEYYEWIVDVFENQTELDVKPMFYTSSGLQNAKPGDANLDGRVDISDFVYFANNFGKDLSMVQQEFGVKRYQDLEMRCRGDFNGDNKINLQDWNILLNNLQI